MSILKRTFAIFVISIVFISLCSQVNSSSLGCVPAACATEEFVQDNGQPGFKCVSNSCTGMCLPEAVDNKIKCSCIEMPVIPGMPAGGLPMGRRRR